MMIRRWVDTAVAVAVAVLVSAGAWAGNARLSGIDFLTPGGVYDGAVSITRDSSGNLILTDTATSTALSSLGGGSTDHGALTGLGNDDHAQYLNTTRHGSAHSATFNNALSITGDVAGNTTLGDHVADASIHYLRDSVIYEVHADGTGPYASLATAASAASAAGGGTIVAHPGVYDVGSGLTLADGVNLIGWTPQNTLIRSSVAGSAVATCSGSTYLGNVTLEHTATDDVASPAVDGTASSAANVIVDNCVLASGGWATIRAGTSTDVTLRACKVSGSRRLAYCAGRVIAYETSWVRVGDRSDETFTVRSAGRNWNLYNCTHSGCSTQAGAFTFASAGGLLYLQNFLQSNGAETALFQTSSASGSAYLSGVNYESLGSSAVTATAYAMGRASFSERVTIAQTDAGAGLQLTRGEGASGNWLTMRDADGDLVAWVDSEGVWWPGTGETVADWATSAGATLLTANADTTSVYWLMPTGLRYVGATDGLAAIGSPYTGAVTVARTNDLVMDVNGARFARATRLWLEWAANGGSGLSLSMALKNVTTGAVTVYAGTTAAHTGTGAWQEAIDITDMAYDADAAVVLWIGINTGSCVSYDIRRIGVEYDDGN